MAFPLPVWLAVQEELLGHGDSADCGAPCCFDDFDDEALFRMFHLTRPCIAFIADAIRIRMRTAGSEPSPLSVDAMVMLALNHYAHGVSSSEVLQRLGLSHTELAVVVISTVSEVIAGMTDQFISFPQTRDARADVALKAEKICGIPNVMGVLAPAHFKIRASAYRHEKSTFRSFVNCLGYSSVVSQIICDCDGNLLSVEHCCVGSTKEQEMWESSLKGREMENDLHGPYMVIGKIHQRLATTV
uniref:DDE Tnp4 domain-containing protein n=1 Tax=Echeneis naucrates TaxID=173247 RepID=A0A665UYX9_ECHNA